MAAKFFKTNILKEVTTPRRPQSKNSKVCQEYMSRVGKIAVQNLDWVKTEAMRESTNGDTILFFALVALLRDPLHQKPHRPPSNHGFGCKFNPSNR
jgi:hypothetical protein